MKMMRRKKTIHAIHAALAYPSILVLLQKLSDGELGGDGAVGDGVISLPCHPALGNGAGAVVRILPEPQCVQEQVTAPLMPAGGVDVGADVRLHHHGSGEVPPRAAEVGGEVVRDGFQVVAGDDVAELERSSGVLVRVRPPLSRHHVRLRRHGFSRDEVAVLKHHRRVAEYEVDGSGDVAVPVKLPFGMSV